MIVPEIQIFKLKSEPQASRCDDDIEMKGVFQIKIKLFPNKNSKTIITRNKNPTKTIISVYEGGVPIFIYSNKLNSLKKIDNALYLSK